MRIAEIKILKTIVGNCVGNIQKRQDKKQEYPGTMWSAGRGAMGKTEKVTVVQSRKEDERKPSTPRIVLEGKPVGTRPEGSPTKRLKDSW